jgi:hypothetical protein
MEAAQHYLIKVVYAVFAVLHGGRDGKMRTSFQVRNSDMPVSSVDTFPLSV